MRVNYTFVHVWRTGVSEFAGLIVFVYCARLGFGIYSVSSSIDFVVFSFYFRGVYCKALNFWCGMLVFLFLVSYMNSFRALDIVFI